jgi:magnesium transporter
MIFKYKYKNTTWIDIESPTRAEILNIIEEYKLPEIMAEELGTCNLRSKVDYYNKLGLIYLVLHFPVITEGEDSVEQEIDFVIGKDFLITTRYEKIDPLHNFSRLFERDTFLDKGNMGDHAGYLFVYLLREIYKHSLDNLENINDSLKTIEKDIFREKKQVNAVTTISETNRKYLNFKQALRHHGEIFRSFEAASVEMFGQSFFYLLGTVSSEYNRVKNTLEVGKEILDDLRDTNDSLLTTRTNNVIGRLTVMTSILLPITLITGIFGMNTSDEVLFIRNAEDFLLVLVLMFIVGLTMVVYFKGKKWL